MADEDKYNWPVETISYQDFSLDGIDLLQRPARVLNEHMNIRVRPGIMDKCNTLFDAGYIHQQGNHQEDVGLVRFYNIINDEHRRRTLSENLIPVSINSEELRELLNNNLKNNHFTILMYLTETEDGPYEASVLVLKSKNGIEVIRRDFESGLPYSISLDDLIEGEEEGRMMRNEEDEDGEEEQENNEMIMYVFGIRGRQEGKRQLQSNIFNLTSRKLPSNFQLPSALSKNIFEMANVNREYSPKRKVLKKKSPVKRKVLKKKSPVKRKVLKKKSPVKRKVLKKKSPVKRKVLKKKSPVKRKVLKKKSPVKRKVLKKK
jgi:hypothetical protein